MKRTPAFLWFLFIPIALVAQQTDVWTLERCIAHALDRNINLKIQRNLGKKAEFTLKQSRWELAPSVNGWGSSGFDFRRSTNQNNDISSGTSYNMSYGLSSSFNLFAGFTGMNTIAANRFNELACGEATKLATNTLIIGIIEQFTLVLYQKALVEVAREQLAVSQKEAERIEATIEAGQMEAVALSEINATVSGNRLLLSRAENEFLMLRLKLAQMIEIPGDASFELSGSGLENILPVETNLTVDSVYTAACLSYPSVLQREYELEQYRKILQISRGNMAPSVSLSGGYNSGFYSTDTLPDGRQSPFSSQFDNYLNPSLGLSLNIPILSGRSRSFQVKKSKVDVENALYSLENQKKQIRQEIEQAILRLESFGLEYLTATDNLAFAEKSFESYREKYRLGLINTTDFMNAQNQLLVAKSNLLQAHYSWIVQKKTIELYIQQP